MSLLISLMRSTFPDLSCRLVLWPGTYLMLQTQDECIKCTAITVNTDFWLRYTYVLFNQDYKHLLARAVNLDCS